MKKRILLTTLAVTFVGLLIFSVITTNLTYRSLLENSKNFLVSQMNVFSTDVYSNDDAGAKALSEALGGERVTFMSPDGTVTGDSDEQLAGTPHADREEVAEAIRDGEGYSTRRSSSVGENMLYYCKQFDDRLVRLSIRTSSEWEVIRSTIPVIFWFVILDVIFCLIFTFFTTNYTLKPVEELARKSRLSVPLETKYKELEPIADILNRKNEEIEKQMDVIKREQARVASAQQSKNEFIANITHEMNTPLTSIKGFAELLESLRPSIEQKGLSLTLDVDPEVTVASRQERLTEIFGNLIRNATKYNKENGSISVTVKGGSTPYAEVADTGIGIAEENLDKIFSRFFTVDKSHSGKNGGFGLGLAVVKKLCDRAGWKLSVRSKLDEGTTFRIEF